MKDGFTAIEMVIVIVMILILVSLTISSYETFKSANIAEGTTQEIGVLQIALTDFAEVCESMPADLDPESPCSAVPCEADAGQNCSGDDALTLGDFYDFTNLPDDVLYAAYAKGDNCAWAHIGIALDRDTRRQLRQDDDWDPEGLGFDECGGESFEDSETMYDKVFPRLGVFQ